MKGCVRVAPEYGSTPIYVLGPVVLAGGGVVKEVRHLSARLVPSSNGKMYNEGRGWRIVLTATYVSEGTLGRRLLVCEVHSRLDRPISLILR